MSARPTPGPWTIGTDTTVSEVCTIHGVPTQPTEDGKGQAWVYIHHPRVVNDEWYYPTDDEKFANAALIAEAGTVHHETQLTPRELAEQRAELLQLAIQYRDDLRHPMTEDSRQRRLERVLAVIAKAGAA